MPSVVSLCPCWSSPATTLSVDAFGVEDECHPRRRAEQVLADALDAASVEAAVLAAVPELVAHELRAIPAAVDPRRFAEDFVRE
jgi:hypothetical protein